MEMTCRVVDSPDVKIASEDRGVSRVKLEFHNGHKLELIAKELTTKKIFTKVCLLYYLY